MTDTEKVDKATVAFRRLLKDAAAEGQDQARVDALVVLGQRTVFAATWPGSESDIRTLTNSQGETAMLLFTARDVLEEAAGRYGWFRPDGSLESAEMGARQALRQAVARSVHFVVLDIGTDYSVEFTREEIEPLLSMESERSSKGPFAGAGKVSSTLMEAVKRSRSDFPPPMESDGQGDSATTSLGTQAGIPTPPPPASGAVPPSPQVPSVTRQRTGTPPALWQIDPGKTGEAMAAASSDSQSAIKASAAPSSPLGAFSSPPLSGKTGSLEAGSVSESSAGSVSESGAGSVSESSMAAAKAVGKAAYVDMEQVSVRPSIPVGIDRLRHVTGPKTVTSAETPTSRSDGSQQFESAEADGGAEGDADSVEAAAQEAAGPEAAGPEAAGPEAAGPEDEVLLRPLLQPLSEDLLERVFEKLRQFPEVEWACTVGGKRGKDIFPVICLRVDPTFTTRVNDIVAIVREACAQFSSQGEVEVMHLTRPKHLTGAREFGTVFFPWRK